jgi:hypothetical protein
VGQSSGPSGPLTGLSLCTQNCEIQKESPRGGGSLKRLLRSGCVSAAFAEVFFGGQETLWRNCGNVESL